MMDWNGHMNAGGWIASIAAMIIILALVVAAIAWIARDLGGRRTREPATTSSSRDLLDRRLANGEINAEQYQQLRQSLGAQPGLLAPDAPAVRAADVHV